MRFKFGDKVFAPGIGNCIFQGPIYGMDDSTEAFVLTKGYKTVCGNTRLVPVKNLKRGWPKKKTGQQERRNVTR